MSSPVLSTGSIGSRESSVATEATHSCESSVTSSRPSEAFHTRSLHGANQLRRE